MAKVEIEISDQYAPNLKKAVVATGLKYRCSAMKKNVIIVSYSEPMELYKLGMKQAEILLETLDKSIPVVKLH